MKQEEREQFFSGQVALGSIWHGPKGMTAQYLNEVVDKRNGLAVVDRDGDTWGWVHDQHKGVGKWVSATTHDKRVGQMSEGMGQPDLLRDYEPYQYITEYPAPTSDPVNPGHYRSHPSGVECIQITEHMNFNLGNATKYVWRAGLKSDDPLEDLRKAAWYVAREIARIENQS